MKLLLHVCCGPCACYPVELLRRTRPDLELVLWFHNPNIHPFTEWARRRDALAYLASVNGLELDLSSPYEPAKFLLELAAEPQSPQRCRRCYALRLRTAAAEAARRSYPAFATTLAFSRQQRHELILAEGRRAAEDFGVDFYYEDWREGWKRGQELARSLGLYRQNYCGCIFSEFERWNHGSI